jgi:TatD DNase family protein
MFDIFAAVPAERIMLETDCPYMSPQNLRGRLNEPANVVAVAEVISAVKDIEYGEFCAITCGNARKFFNKMV